MEVLFFSGITERGKFEVIDIQPNDSPEISTGEMCSIDGIQSIEQINPIRKFKFRISYSQTVSVKASRIGK